MKIKNLYYELKRLILIFLEKQMKAGLLSLIFLSIFNLSVFSQFDVYVNANSIKDSLAQAVLRLVKIITGTFTKLRTGLGDITQLSLIASLFEKIYL